MWRWRRLGGKDEAVSKGHVKVESVWEGTGDEVSR